MNKQCEIQIELYCNNRLLYSFANEIVFQYYVTYLEVLEPWKSADLRMDVLLLNQIIDLYLSEGEHQERIWIVLY